VQWLADRQLARCAGRAAEAGMGIGLFRDLPVGSAPGGVDAWSEPGAQGWGIGAPPDAGNAGGPKWGLQPPAPTRLRNLAYRPFIAMLRANMRHAGALRIDHALGLSRLFWIPDGGRPSDGAYVRYDFDALAGLVALESQRHRCLVVGEDLGTI